MRRTYGNTGKKEPFAKTVVMAAVVLPGIGLLVAFVQGFHVLIQLPVMGAGFLILVLLGDKVWKALGGRGHAHAKWLIRRWPLLILLLGALGLGATRVLAPDRYEAFMAEQDAKRSEKRAPFHVLLDPAGKQFQLISYSKAATRCRDLGDSWYLASRDELFDRARDIQKILQHVPPPESGLSFWTQSTDEDHAWVVNLVPDKHNPGTTRWVSEKLLREAAASSAMCARRS